MPTFACHPFLHRNKPSRESIFCGKVSDWWTKRVLIMLNFLLKIRQVKLAVNLHEWSTARKTHALAAASVSGCRACCSQTTGTASWKRRSNWPQTSNLQLVEMPLNNSHQSLFLNPNRSLDRLPVILVFSIASCSSFVCLSASCLSYSLDVARYVFKNKAGNMLNNQTKSAQALTTDLG